MTVTVEAVPPAVPPVARPDAVPAEDGATVPAAPRILVLGGKAGIVRKAAALGLDVVQIQKPSAFDPSVVGHCAQVHLLDYQDIPLVTALARALHTQRPFVRVFTQTEAAQVVAGHLTTELGLPGSGVRTARLLHDKRALRALLNEHRLGAVAAEPGTTREALRAFVAAHGAAVVKPAMGSGSLGVRKVHGTDEVDEVWQWLQDFGVGEFLTEELLVGTELSVEAFSVGGRHTVVAVTGKDTGAGVVELGHVVPAPLPGEQRRDVGDFVRAVLDLAGHVDGPSHTEIILTESGPRVVESHGRRGGDRINELVGLVHQVDFEQLAYRLAVEADPLPVLPPADGAAAIRFLVAEPGVVTEVRGIEAAAAADGVVQVDVQVAPGDTVHELRWSEDRCGYVMVRAADARTAVRRAREVAESIEIRTVPAELGPQTLTDLLTGVDEVLDPFGDPTPSPFAL